MADTRIMPRFVFCIVGFVGGIKKAPDSRGVMAWHSVSQCDIVRENKGKTRRSDVGQEEPTMRFLIDFGPFSIVF